MFSCLETIRQMIEYMLMDGDSSDDNNDDDKNVDSDNI